jgi:hypothetical protein
MLHFVIADLFYMFSSLDLSLIVCSKMSTIGYTLPVTIFWPHCLKESSPSTAFQISKLRYCEPESQSRHSMFGSISISR